MKKILIFILILITFDVVEAYSKLVVKVKWGRARDCKSMGICFLVFNVDEITESKGQTNAIIDYTKSQHLTISFNKTKDITQETFEKYFSKGSFICEDDFPVPAEILKALNYPGPYTIKAGEYPITIIDDILTIEF